ncbi:MAG: hypothetical protein U0942_07835 [Parvibaculum sp.]|uniref:hypothetical protein n=1 Tax=Parvibaculum sp. TaxID=2024848 RepID=UPI002AB8ECDF|nr:hypothetical protein [Parvibaculum sp.]MDZ4381234.1 hypothetical protein [Parvibaculum sp.]
MSGTLFSLLALVIAGLGWVIRQEMEKRRRIEEQLSQEKYETYMILVDAFFDMFSKHATTEENSSPTQEADPEFVETLRKFNKRLIFYGSDSVISAHQRYMDSVYTGDTVFNQMELFGALITAIRKDMGYPNTKFSPKTFMKQILNDYHTSIGPGGTLEKLHKKYPDL